MAIEPNRNVYVGHRYVPKVMGEWDNSQKYEGLCIVTYQGASYTSKGYVPVGVDINDEDYWTVTGNYNAQVENYRLDVERYRDEVQDMGEYVDDEVEKLNIYVNDETASTRQYVDGEVSDLTNHVNTNVDDLTDFVNGKVGWISVKEYGAKGDGITDDTEAINSAINDIPVNTTLYFPTGVYMVSGIQVNKREVHITGIGNAVIKQIPGVLDTTILYLRSHEAHISNITVKGDWDTVTDTNHGIDTGSSRAYLTNIRLYEINGNGLRSSGDNSLNTININKTSGWGMTLSADNAVSNIHIGQAGKGGMILTGGHNSISSAVIWMSGNNGRDENEDNENAVGLRINSTSNSISSLTVFASNSHGIFLSDSHYNNIQAVSELNGRGDNIDKSSGLILAGSGHNIIDISASNNPNLSGESWGHQRSGVHFTGYEKTVGNKVDVISYNTLDPVVYHEQDQTIIRANTRNKVTLINERGDVSKTTDVLPSPSELLQGMVVTYKNDTHDELRICMKRESDGEFKWYRIDVTDV